MIRVKGTVSARRGGCPKSNAAFSRPADASRVVRGARFQLSSMKPGIEAVSRVLWSTLPTAA